MNKKEAFQTMWIDFKTRLPPDTEEEILIYIDMIGCVEVTTAKICRLQQQQMQNSQTKKARQKEYKLLKKTGYFADKWMKVHRPHD